MRTRAGVSANGLRREVSARNLVRAAAFAHEETYGSTTSVVYHEGEDGIHGNFLPSVYRRIAANERWSQRLRKTYTGSSRIVRSSERKRAELDCCTSSDALLMNVFCYPRVLCRSRLCKLLGIDRGLDPEFGVRAGLPMKRGEIDRTELDLRLGSLLVESKLTETGFGFASRERLLRYTDVESVFDVESLSWGSRGVAGYQLVRGALAAHNSAGRYLLLWDEGRSDLHEQWFRVLSAMRSSELRSRMLLLSWQELAATLPGTLQVFLRTKYGILPARG